MINEEIKTRRQRRRRRLEGTAKNDIQAVIENVEQTIKAHAVQSSRQLIRKNTFTIQKFENASHEEQTGSKDTERSWDNSKESNNFTYSINKESEESAIDNPQNLDLNPGKDKNEFHPVPAPRKRLRNITEPEKMSSDTDRDVTELDLDDLRSKSTKSGSISLGSDKKSATAPDLRPVPVPKPRKIIDTIGKALETENANKPTFTSDENLHKNTCHSDPNTDSERAHSNEIPLVKSLLEEAYHAKQNEKKRNFIGDFFKQTKQIRKRKSSGVVLKLENKKIPRISTLLKELKENEKVTKTEDKEEGKGDFQEDSLQYPEPVQNKHFYVQSKHGFHIMEKEEALKSEEAKIENEEKGGKMEDSTVRTAILFQNYWSRSMISFHGILAGFALGHAATVTSIMLRFNYEPQAFVDVYSSLSLKIHYVFYALIALCIVSCFDRLDLGHINKKHLQIAWKVPSMWMILCLYLMSFGLSFSNQMTEVKFDSLARGNHTNVWWGNEDQVSLLQWYHTVWARDVLVLLAWLLISLTKFPDYLHAHLVNMAKYFDVKSDDVSLRRLPG